MSGTAPLILAVDDDPARLGDVERELRNRYELDYRVRCLASAREAQETLAELGADALFLVIGARPHTGWLPPTVALDGDGFIRTGTDLGDGAPAVFGRRPFALETSIPGVLAAGDVRSGSVERVASAVGEGSIAIQQVHRLLAAPPAVVPAPRDLAHDSPGLAALP